MKVITFDDIRSLHIAPLDCYLWAEEMIRNKSNALLPAKISMKPEDEVFCNVMPCILDNGFGGVKIVTRYPNRVPSLDSRMILFDSVKGDFLALMDADWITTMRTGAVAAHSIKLFAKSGFSTISILGLGNTARATLLVLSDLFPNKEFNIKLLKYREQEYDFINRFKAFSNLKFTVVDDYRSLIKASDVVISAVTYFADDICEDDWFDEGITLIPIHTRGFTNCDLFFDKVYADDTNHVKHFKNFNKFKYYAEVGDVVNSKAIGRTSDSERIIVYNIGVSMHDVYFGSKIYNKLKERKLTEINMLEPQQKFWV